MHTTDQEQDRRYGPACFCRMEAGLIQALAGERDQARIAFAASLLIIAGTMCYGSVFGLWRAPLQACYSALKLPVLIFTVVTVSSLINTMLAQVFGSGLSYRQVWLCILLSLAVTATLLGALSPVVLFFVLQSPPPTAPEALRTYRAWLLVHTAVIGAGGILGHIRLYRLLKALTPSPAIARRVLWSWILATGLAGCELSWVISPFLAKPGEPIPFINPDAFRGNFFEYLGRTIENLL